MSMDVLRTDARDVAASGTRRLSVWLPLIVIFAAGILLRNFVVANTDVSWLITLCEKILDGEKPYVDFIETNPPAAFLLYMLPVMFARALALRPEPMVDAFVFSGAIVSLLFSARIVQAAGLFSRRTVFQLAALFAAALVILPAQTFGEREHIALIAFLPLLAVCAVRDEGKKVALGFAIAAGIGAGVIGIIKPHFIVAIVLVAAVAAWNAKSWRIFFAPEHWISSAMCMAYAVLTYLLYPEFISQILPLVAEIYVPIRASFWKFIIHFGTPIYAAVFAVIFALKGREAFRSPYSLLLAASIGFSFSYYSQMKGWAYHAYPMLALALVAAVIGFAARWPAAASEDGSNRRKRLATAFTVAFLAGATFVWMNFSLDMRALREPIAPSVTSPKVLAITSDIGVGHPLTRALNGTWVGRVCGQWIATGAKILKLETADTTLHRRYDELEAHDRAMLIEDIRRAKPDIILVDRIRYDWYEWAKGDVTLSRELENYRALEQINDVLILRRK